MYACPNVRSEERFAYVNTSGMQAFRAPGYVEGAFGLESAMNVLAGVLQMDPLALRLRNFSTRDPRKDRPYSGNNLRECYSQGAERFGWGTRPAPAASTTASRLRRGPDGDA